MNVPVYNPAGTVKAQKQQSNNASAEAFGAGIGRAQQQFGAQLSAAGDRLWKSGFDAAAEEQQKTQASNVMGAYTQASDQLRQGLYNPENGIYNRTGANAKDLYVDAAKTADQIEESILGGLESEEEKEAFRKMWRRKSEGTKDQAAKTEFNRLGDYRKEQQASSLSGIQADAVANYQDPDLLKATFDAARAMIRTNQNGFSPEGVERLERETISALHVSVAQRLAQDDPGKAADYYQANKAQIHGGDHATIDKYVSGVTRARKARSAVEEIMGNGQGRKLVEAVQFAESNGDPAAFSSAGAMGLMQVMPDTAREVANQLGLRHIANMSDSDLRVFFSSEEGQVINKRLGTKYLSDQLRDFNGDVELALIAYNAGPGNARKFVAAGRDYNALPKRSETEPYVQRVMARFTGANMDFGQGEGSKRIQSAIGSGKPFFQGGSANEYLKTKLFKGKNASHIDGLTPVMQDRVAALFSSAPEHIQKGLGVLSGARTPEHQARIISNNLGKYGLGQHARAWQLDVEQMGAVAAGEKWRPLFKQKGMTKWIAPPGGSNHQKGNATDIGWNGGKLSSAPPEVVQWLHANANKYGLKFPMSHEPWHIETSETRGGGGKTGRHDKSTPGQPVNHSQTSTIEIADDAPDASALYTSMSTPFSVAEDSGDVSDWIAQAREDYKDNPTLLAEVERQIKLEATKKDAAHKKQITEMTNEAFREILNGKRVDELDPNVLQALGPTGVKSLMGLEGKFDGSGGDVTDDATYYELTQMDPEDFANVDLMTYAPKLSGADFRAMANKQKAYKTKGSEVARATDLTRTQITTNAQQMLGLQPTRRTKDAESMATLNRAMNAKITAFMAMNNGKEPTGDEMQAMMDELLIKGEVSNAFINDDARVYELTPEKAAKFMVEGQTVENFEEIPIEAHNEIATSYKKIFRANPDEKQAIRFYNDVARISMGANPLPPDSIRKVIEQGLLQRLGRRPTPEEVANTYSAAITKSIGAN
jgi:hypothetical protein